MFSPQIEPSVIEKAIAFAVQKHAGQRDKVGRPYILHPLRIMAGMETDEERLVALLHDVIEDCPDVSPADLQALGLPNSVIDTIRLLTHPKDEPYDAYIERIGRHPIARKVKLGDLRDNMDLRRLPLVTEKDAKRLSKYIRAYRRLSDTEAKAV